MVLIFPKNIFGGISVIKINKLRSDVFCMNTKDLNAISLFSQPCEAICIYVYACVHTVLHCAATLKTRIYVLYTVDVILLSMVVASLTWSHHVITALMTCKGVEL